MNLARMEALAVDLREYARAGDRKAIAELRRIAEATGAVMVRDPGGGVATATAGSGSGLPSGGSPLQTVINTAPGTGTWQDLSNAMAAGSSHIVLTDVAHVATIDLSTADKNLLSQSFTSHYVRAWSSVTQSLTASTPTGITFDTNIYDTDGFHSTVSNTTRITIPANLGGLYLIGGNLDFAGAVTTNNTFCRIYKNGNPFTGGNRISESTTSSSAVFAAGLHVCVAGDFFELFGFQDSAGAQNTASATSSAQPITPGFWAVLLAPSSTAGIASLTPVNKTTAYTAVANDWVLADTTGGTFAVTLTAIADKAQLAVTWKAGAAAPTFAGTSILGSPTFGAVGNTILLQYSTLQAGYLVV